jgi:hypothetical protein
MSTIKKKGKRTLSHEKAVEFGRKGGSPLLKPKIVQAYYDGRLVIKPKR